uniref:Uncharacterized protein n=1 Tax=Cryptomonas paramaecium TaxID=2898 RepID=A0A7S4V1V8_9CRYP|mmetsp:Transcript_10086/g.28933  ORF Transcript_10086/g.28933 Transcript_10086/m.28933 type:complete len:190 (+) Transcript_10086:3-572(+)
MWFLFQWIESLLQALGLKNKSARIVVVGLDNAGKSTLVHKLCTNEVRSFVPTTKAHNKTFTLGRIEFTAWDLGGHEQVRDLWEDFYSTADAIVFMIDSSDTQRFSEARSELDKILESDSLRSVPILILGNKTDLEGSEERENIIESLNVRKFFSGEVEDDEDRPLQVFMCSLVASTGYVEGFQWLSKQL